MFLRAGLDILEKIKLSCCFWDSNPGPSLTSSVVAIPTALLRLHELLTDETKYMPDNITKCPYQSDDTAMCNVSCVIVAEVSKYVGTLCINGNRDM
jgi:hypothetical protein